MSCNNFTSNSQPKVVLSGTLPSNFCHSTWQNTFIAFRNAITGYLPDNYSTFLVSDQEPAASDRDKVWIHVDPTTCQPIGAKLYVNGTWVSIGGNVFWGVDSSNVDNTITVTATTPSVTWVQTGHMFLVKSARANSGSVSVTISNGTTVYNSVVVKKYGSDLLSGLEILAGQVCALVYDGTNFQLLNPRTSSGVSTGGGGGGTSSSGDDLNFSFESDANNDGIPDRWNVYVAGASYPGNGGAASDSATSPNGGSFTLDSSVVISGKKSAKFTCQSGTGNGGAPNATTGSNKGTIVGTDSVFPGWQHAAEW